MQTQIVCQKLASKRTVQRQTCLRGGHITGAPVASSNQGQPFPPSLNHMSMASIIIPPACENSEKREILFVGRKSSLDKQNISQKTSKPKYVFCPIQPHQCGNARHNRIAGIVHMRTPTARKKPSSFTLVKRGKKAIFFPHVHTA